MADFIDPAPWSRPMRLNPNLDGFGKRHLPGRPAPTDHWGEDRYRSNLTAGWPVYAIRKGPVKEAATTGAGNVFAGPRVAIHHPDKYNGSEYSTRYLHLDGTRLLVRVGQVVAQGDIIGYIGTRDQVGRDPKTGLHVIGAPHLHFETRRLAGTWVNSSGPKQGTAVNPQTLLAGTPIPVPSGGGIMFCKQGDKSEIVKYRQEQLAYLGYDLTFAGGPPRGIDGSYGAKTTTAVAHATGTNGAAINGPEAFVLDTLVARKAGGGGGLDAKVVTMQVYAPK